MSEILGQYLSKRFLEIELILGGIASMCHGKRAAIYLSTPVTTGPRYVKWLEGGANSRSQLASVLVPNVDHARKIADNIRLHHDGLLINPVDLPDPAHNDWCDGDYMVLWLTAIQRYVRRVYTNTGWHLSNGCVSEVAYAITNSRPVSLIDETKYYSDLPISVHQAQEMISEGRSKFIKLGIQTQQMDIALKALQTYQDDIDRAYP